MSGHLARQIPGKHWGGVGGGGGCYRLTDEQREVYMEYLQSRECQAILQGKYQVSSGQGCVCVWGWGWLLTDR